MYDLIRKALLTGVAVLGLAGAAGAMPALEFTGGAEGRGLSVYVHGWEFDVSSPVDVAGLALFDWGGNGLDDSHEVGIWAPDGTLLHSVTIPEGDTATLEDGYRVVDIRGESLSLVPGSGYVIAATRFNTDAFAFDAESVTTIPEISFVQSLTEDTGGSLSRPGDPGVPNSYFGPNFTVDAPPPAEPIIEETFAGYLDNALISDSPAGPAVGLTGDWTLVPNSNFYVNKTATDDDAGTGKAVYDRPSGDNGAREATRSTSSDHPLFESDGDVFYASFLIDPPRADGHMTFELELRRLDGGGTPAFSFGIVGGTYIVGNGGIDVDASGGTVPLGEQLVLVRVEYGDAQSGPDADEVVTIWVDPIDESSTPVLDGVATDFLNSGGGAITAVSMRGEQMAGQPAFFDDLLVGASFESVLPEPAAPSQLAIVLVALLMIRRYR